MCRNCGSIVGAGESQCAVCGTSVAPVQPRAARRQPPDRETLRFARAIVDRPYKFTIIFLVTNFFLFLLMWQSSGLSFSVLGLFPYEVLVAYGAKLNSLVREGQWWRLVTPMFLHVNLLHLLVNMYSLWIVGPYVEKLYGSAKFVLFWVATGIAAVVASYFAVVSPDVMMKFGVLGRFLLKTQDEPSAGASGALFGLVGVLFVFGIKFRHELPEGFKRAFGTGLLPMIMLNLFIGYIGRGFIDNAAHLGGLISGGALALIVDYRRPGERAGVAIVWRVLQFAALAVVAVSFLMVARHFNDPLSAPATSANLGPIVQAPNHLQYFTAVNDAQDALSSYLVNNDASALDSARERLESVPSLDAEADKLRDRLREYVVQAKTLSQPPGRGRERSPQQLQQQKNELIEEINALVADYERWVETNGKKYGAVLQEKTPDVKEQTPDVKTKEP